MYCFVSAYRVDLDFVNLPFVMNWPLGKEYSKNYILVLLGFSLSKKAGRERVREFMLYKIQKIRERKKQSYQDRGSYFGS